MSSVPLLTADAMCKSFGALNALDDCAIEVSEGTITALIGPNGSGKTTSSTSSPDTCRQTPERFTLPGRGFADQIRDACFAWVSPGRFSRPASTRG